MGWNCSQSKQNRLWKWIQLYIPNPIYIYMYIYIYIFISWHRIWGKIWCFFGGTVAIFDIKKLSVHQHWSQRWPQSGWQDQCWKGWGGWPFATLFPQAPSPSPEAVAQTSTCQLVLPQLSALCWGYWWFLPLPTHFVWPPFFLVWEIPHWTFPSKPGIRCHELGWNATVFEPDREPGFQQLHHPPGRARMKAYENIQQEHVKCRTIFNPIFHTPNIVWMTVWYLDESHLLHLGWVRFLVHVLRRWICRWNGDAIRGLYLSCQELVSQTLHQAVGKPFLMGRIKQCCISHRDIQGRTEHQSRMCEITNHGDVVNDVQAGRWGPGHSFLKNCPVETNQHRIFFRQHSGEETWKKWNTVS